MSKQLKKEDQSFGEEIIRQWFRQKNWTVFDFQKEVWTAIFARQYGLLNAPTGSGKTYALWFPALINFLNKHPEDYKTKAKNGLKVLWLTPLRALSKDIRNALDQVCIDLEIPWRVECRTGDTSAAQKQKQKRQMPEALITTPESLHILLAQKNYEKSLAGLDLVVVDEWHELLGTKRGIAVELALSRIRAFCPNCCIWGVSATIGNLNEAHDVLLGKEAAKKRLIIKSLLPKRIQIETIIPDNVESLPWAGHLGARQAPKVAEIIQASNSSLVFTNTKSQSEIWYKQLLEIDLDLAGQMALHHGAIDRDIRNWIEDALDAGTLKAVVCTSSLDLGVDFKPVDTVIQIGGPKGIARFLQRAGRSGHQPGALSKIYFAPTNAFELIEAEALKTVNEKTPLESRPLLIKPFDVLSQYIVTLAVSDGFKESELFTEITSTYSYQDLSKDEWQSILHLLINGGDSLGEYDEFCKLEREGELLKVLKPKIARRHRMSIGTIVSAAQLKVKLIKGGVIGTIEEYFISRLKIGDTFSFSGRMLEYVRTKDMMALVRIAKKKKGLVPAWLGSQMPLSSELSKRFRKVLSDIVDHKIQSLEIQVLKPVLDAQKRWSIIPDEETLLIESIPSRDGFHLFVFPFEGRRVHEGLAALLAFRIAQYKPMSISMAMNDYGFELLSNEPIEIEEALKNDLFNSHNLIEDIQASLNATEMAKRRFRAIAKIAGLVFQGYPGKPIRTSHLHASTQLIFDVFEDYEPNNLLLRQAYDEVFNDQLEEVRLRESLKRMSLQKHVVIETSKFSPFAFPITIDRIREKMTTEQLSDRIRRMQLEVE